MDTGAALAALLAWAATLDAPVAQAPAAIPERVVLTVDLADVSRGQDKAWLSRPAGASALDFALGLDAQGLAWVKFRQGGRIAAHPWTRLQPPGVEESFPGGRFLLRAAGSIVEARPLPEGGAVGATSLGELVELLYGTARRVRFEPVEYALAYESGESLPPSLCLVRRDREGRHWVTHRSLEELRGKVNWFLAVDGVLFGMRLEASALHFVSKPVPAGDWRAAEAPLR